MSIRNTAFIIIVLFSLLAACDPGSQRRVDRETLEREHRLREPQRIKEGQIVNVATEQGEALVQLLQEKGNSSDSSCCLQLPPAFIDSLQRQYQVQIRCYSLLAPAVSDFPKEQELLDAYAYSREQNIPLQANIQPVGKEGFLYTAPAANGTATTSSCGVWSIRMDRKQVVLSIMEVE